MSRCARRYGAAEVPMSFSTIYSYFTLEKLLLSELVLKDFCKKYLPNIYIYQQIKLLSEREKKLILLSLFFFGEHQ